MPHAHDSRTRKRVVGGGEPPMSAPSNSDPEAPSGSAEVTAPEPGIWERIREHKIIQWTLAYLGGALALAHGGELLSHTYGWPEIVQRILVSSLIVGFPLALVLAWYHGHKGFKRVTEGELMIAAILLLIGAGLMMSFVRTPERTGNEENLTAPRPGEANSQPVPPDLSVHASSVPRIAPRASGKPRIAILPFENLSPDPANAFFTDGMHEEILTALSSNAPGLEVVSRTTMMSFKGKPVTAQQVARELGATHVLEGSVRREGDHVRVTLQLIDGATDNHLWSKDYDRALKDALTLQAAIASAVTDQLSVTMLTAAERAKPPTSAEAYDLYLKAALGFQELGTYSPLAAFRQVDDLLQKALSLDPNFALAHLQRARLRSLLFISNYEVSEESVKLWRSELDAARRLAPDDPRVLSGLAEYAFAADHDWVTASGLFDRVETCGLTQPSTLSQKADMLISMGRLDEATALGLRALELDPRSLPEAVAPVQSLWLAHRASEAWHVIVTGPSRSTPLFAVARFYFKGVSAQTLPFAQPAADAAPSDPDQTIDTLFEFARYADHVGAVKAMLERASVDSVRVSAFQVLFANSGVGRRPIGELRGWADLLVGDRSGAAQQSKPIRDFIMRTPPTRWNEWFLRMLTADASLFGGDKPAAIAAAKDAMAKMPCSADALLCLYPQYLGAQVLAWAGDANAAVAILERVSLETPGIAPAIAVRDPLFSAPLANNARYKVLREKLEKRMEATTLE